jgi:acid phosphatase
MRDPRTAAVVVAALLAVGSCGGTARPTTAPQAPAGETGQVRRTHENLNATLWMQTAVEYQASARQAYRAAQLAIDAALRDKTWTAATEQINDASALPPAIVLDLDETVLDNSPFEARMIAASTPQHAVGYDENEWRRWVAERKATAIPGAVDFLHYAVSRGVTPIYITNRNIQDADGKPTGEKATIDVLRDLDVPVDAAGETVLMRGEHGWDSSDKAERRRFVAERYRILLLVGDNFEDFVSPTDKSMAGRDVLAAKFTDWWGWKWIVLPNPTYGSWEQAITMGAPDDRAALARKYAALRLAR